jgi:hypothetical protein
MDAAADVSCRDGAVEPVGGGARMR